MPTPDQVLTYEAAVGRLEAGRRHLLLGNGFSIGCDPIFRYESLYHAAINVGLSERAQQVFQRLGTNNFEGVMKLLDDTHWVATTYDLIAGDRSGMLEDVDVVKRTLVEAVATSHLANTGLVSTEKKTAALAFLEPFHNIFTTNYDLLVYWVNMFQNRERRWKDGFHADEDDPDAAYVVFSERLGDQKGIFYLHGALHLYIAGGELRKHCWSRTQTPLTDLIRQGLAGSCYPLFVAEGDPDRKLEQIQRSGYLWYCLDKLARINGPLVILGHSLGDSDSHIANCLADNPGLHKILIGLHGDVESERNEAIAVSVERIVARRNALVERRRLRAGDLEIIYFRSETANVWP